MPRCLIGIRKLVSSRICRLFRVPHRNLIIAGRWLFYRVASWAVHGSFDWCIGQPARLWGFAGAKGPWFFWHNLFIKMRRRVWRSR
jgi:hypothetical protein